MIQFDPPPPPDSTSKKLTLALAAYAVIAALAAVTLEGNLRLAVWILMGGLAVKTWIASASDSNR